MTSRLAADGNCKRCILLRAFITEIMVRHKRRRFLVYLNGYFVLFSTKQKVVTMEAPIKVLFDFEEKLARGLPALQIDVRLGNILEGINLVDIGVDLARDEQVKKLACKGLLFLWGGDVSGHGRSHNLDVFGHEAEEVDRFNSARLNCFSLVSFPTQLEKGGGGGLPHSQTQ